MHCTSCSEYFAKKIIISGRILVGFITCAASNMYLDWIYLCFFSTRMGLFISFFFIVYLIYEHCVSNSFEEKNAVWQKCICTSKWRLNGCKIFLWNSANCCISGVKSIFFSFYQIFSYHLVRYSFIFDFEWIETNKRLNEDKTIVFVLNQTFPLLCQLLTVRVSNSHLTIKTINLAGFNNFIKIIFPSKSRNLFFSIKANTHVISDPSHDAIWMGTTCYTIVEVYSM